MATSSPFNFPGGLTLSPEPSFSWPSELLSGPSFSQTPPIVSGSNAGVPGSSSGANSSLNDALAVGQSALAGATSNLLFWAIVFFVVGLLVLAHISYHELGR